MQDPNFDGKTIFNETIVSNGDEKFRLQVDLLQDGECDHFYTEVIESLAATLGAYATSIEAREALTDDQFRKNLSLLMQYDLRFKAQLHIAKQQADIVLNLIEQLVQEQDK